MNLISRPGPNGTRQQAASRTPSRHGWPSGNKGWEPPLGKSRYASSKGIREVLEAIYRRERSRLAAIIENDPLWFARRYWRREDVEIAAFLSSQFAYGRVASIRAFLERLFAVIGKNPAGYVARGDFSLLLTLYYRLHKGNDLVELFTVLKRVMGEFGGIGNMVAAFHKGDIRRTLTAIRHHLFDTGDRLLFFFPRGDNGSALKRWNLYLRWMVRRDEIDLGLWGFIKPEELVVPLDAHIYNVGRCRGWTKARSATWKAAVEITEALKRFDRKDPVKYDFLLCHVVGMQGRCSGRSSESCRRTCMIYDL